MDECVWKLEALLIKLRAPALNVWGRHSGLTDASPACSLVVRGSPGADSGAGGGVETRGGGRRSQGSDERKELTLALLNHIQYAVLYNAC